MTEDTKRYQITLDTECVDIIDFFEKKEMKPSGTVRAALKCFYESYVERSLGSGEAVISPDGELSTLDRLAAAKKVPQDINIREDQQ